MVMRDEHHCGYSPAALGVEEASRAAERNPPERTIWNRKYTVMANPDRTAVGSEIVGGMIDSL